MRGKIGRMLDTRRLVGGKGKGDGSNGSNLPRSLRLRREREESRQGIRGLRCGDAYCFLMGVAQMKMASLVWKRILDSGL